VEFARGDFEVAIVSARHAHTVSSKRAVDLTRPIRKIMREMGIPGFPDARRIEFPPQALQWTRRGATAPWATVEVRLELESCRGTAWLRYDVHHASRRTGPQKYPVALVSTPCNFGGVRWWWICPATGRRVRKIYLPNGGARFLSPRGGWHNLAYASQRRDKMGRIHARISRLYARLKADYPGLTISQGNRISNLSQDLEQESVEVVPIRWTVWRRV
jgi:hypothetical protein